MIEDLSIDEEHPRVLKHNIVQIQNNVIWDWQYYVEYSSHSICMQDIVIPTLLWIWMKLWNNA